MFLYPREVQGIVDYGLDSRFIDFSKISSEYKELRVLENIVFSMQTKIRNYHLKDWILTK